MASMDMHTEVYQGTSLAANTLALNVQAVVSNTTVTGNMIDTSGVESLEFILIAGARTDGTFTPSIFESDVADIGTATAVDLDYVLGNYAQSALSVAQSVKRIGYVGKMRYVWLRMTSTTVTSGATIGAVAVLGYAHEEATPYP